MIYAHGNFIEIKDVDVTPSLASMEARDIFANYKNIPIDSIISFQSELLIKEIYYQATDSLSIPKLVYKIELETEVENNDEIGYVDAHTGSVVATAPKIWGATYNGTFSTRYSGSQTAKTMLSSGEYFLKDDSREAIIHTKNLNNTTSISNAVEITDNDNNWTSTEHSTNNIDMGLDVHWALQEIYDYFQNNFGINSFEDNGTEINAYIRYGDYTDDRDNAGWSSTSHYLVFGEGYTKYNPVASIDAVAHEYGHGISDLQIGLSYDAGTMGAIQEGLSDIWAVILESAINPIEIWQIGDLVVNSGSCIRNIENPTDPDAEIQMSNTYNSTSYNEAANHYVKSGVFSYWFYLLVNGGNDTNENGDSYSIYGIGMDNAEEFITNSIYDGYLDGVNSFSDLYSAFSNAASIYYGSSSFIKNQVDMAWYAVGVSSEPGSIDYDISGASIMCNSSEEIYYINGDIPSNATVSWTSDSDISIISSTNTSATCSGNGYGSAWLKATVTINEYSFEVTNYDIAVGAPSTIYVSSTSSLNYDYSSGSYQIVEGSGNYQYTGELVVDEYYGLATGYQWTKVSGSTLIPINWSANDNSVSVYTKAADRTLILSCTASNSCGSYTKNYSFFTGDVSPLAIYPNPASSEVEIELIGLTSAENSVTEYNVEIIDNTMQVKKKLKMNSSSQTINISNLRKGIYFVVLKTEEGNYTEKLIIE